MSTLTVDIVARVNDTLKKLGATEAQIRDVNEALKANAPAAKASAAAMDNLGKAANNAGAAARGSSQKFFQFGQAISDFSVAGIRGAANNLEVLALQMGVGGPLLLAIAAATSALVVFGDDILKALDPVGERVKELRDGLEEVLTIVETGGVDLILFEDQIPQAIEESTAAVAALQAQLQALQNPRSAGPGFTFGGVGRGGEIAQLQQDLAAALAILEGVQAKRDEFAQRDEAAGAARKNSIIEENALRDEALRQELEGLGFGRELLKIKDGQLLKMEREGTLQEFITGLKDKAAKATRQEVSELDRAQKKVEELSAELEARRIGELDTLAALRDQAQALQRQIALVRELNEARAEQAERDARFGPPQRATPAGTQQPGFLDALNSLRATREREARERQESEIGADFLRGLPDGLAESMAEQAAAEQQKLREEFAQTIELSEQLAATLTIGLADALGTLAGAFGQAVASSQGFKGFGQAALGTLADVAGQVGKIAVGTGIAISGIKKALESLNPVAAIAGGLALIALSSAVKSRLGSVSAGASGGGSFSVGSGISRTTDLDKLNTLGFERLPNGAVVPVQPSTPAASFTPLPPGGVQTVIVEGSFDLEGENLRAAVRNTDKRVQSTRGVAA